MLTCGDQSSADLRIKSNLAVDRLALLRKSALVLVLRLREEAPDQPVIQIENLIRHGGRGFNH